MAVWQMSLFILFGIAIAMILGLADLRTFYPAYTISYNQSEVFMGNITGTGSNLGSNILTYWLSATFGVAVVSVLLLKYAGADTSIAILAGVIGGMAVFYISPIDILRSLDMPYEINYILVGFLTFLFIISIVEFIRR